MNYLRGFLPWIVLAIASFTLGWWWGAVAALGAAVALLAQDRRAGREAGALEFGGAAYFVALAALAFVAPHSPLEAYDGALSSAWLAVVAGIGLATGRPFTLAVARRSVDEETARHPMFLHVNTVLTAVWAVSFATTALLGAASVALSEPEPVRIAVQALGFALPALFTRAYVARIGARRAVLAAA
ncbi:hypothetical protein [Tsukamurella ocularis]|uniref:hypothetical protein n=1 Tax=Tsukamurella ocularis TaxID=1970234 RepID=UPI002168A737|nr:hypothetical protein [Tsukamurella ocularis]MCS3781739.1 hypothetical protein [Tsukamurella ocularis]MCS3788233.1 hypothetical protein [Tsukamurella ocularis]MCS3851953.1 hypothetical protein [Tsukamurella ocularis]